jgi:O-antigen biosynthesis protein
MAMIAQSLPSVSLIILNWNGQPYLEGCLKSLLQQSYPQAEIIMVDNGSTDSSVTYVKKAFPDVRIIETGRNLGFAGGMNAGIAETSADIVVLLNNDIIAETDWLSQLIDCMQSDQKIGIAGCKIFFADGKTLQHAGGYLSHPLGLPQHYGYREDDNGKYDKVADVDYVTGAAIAIRQSVIGSTGGLDADFFPIYYEDVDICYRAREAGWRVVYAPESRLIHLESATMVRDSYSYLLCFHQGRMRFLLKHMDPNIFLDEFVPAELDRMPKIGLIRERRALKRAYKSALRILPTVYANRFGCNQTTLVELESVADAFYTLHHRLTQLF